MHKYIKYMKQYCHYFLLCMSAVLVCLRGRGGGNCAYLESFWRPHINLNKKGMYAENSGVICSTEMLTALCLQFL
jgi:hypothetical protein